MEPSPVKPPSRRPLGALGWKGFAFIVLVEAAAFALLFTVPGIGKHTQVMMAAVLAACGVAPILGAQAGYRPGALLAGSALAGELAAVLYAIGQGGLLLHGLVIVEIAALLPAPAVLATLRRLRVPGIPPDEGRPTASGVGLIVVLAFPALVAGTLAAMARRPVVAVAGAVCASTVAGLLSHDLAVLPLEVGLAAVLALVPSGVSRIIRRDRRRPGPQQEELFDLDDRPDSHPG